MIYLLSAGKNKKNLSVKYLLFTFFICISLVTWLGISDLRADADDLEPNSDEFEEGFQNITQEQRADILANEAYSQDQKLDVSGYKDLIQDMRESGMGWGKIVYTLNANTNYDLDIHPSVLGLGHSPKSSDAVHSSKQSSTQSGNHKGQSLALGHSKDNGGNLGGGHGGGHGGGNGGGHGGGGR